MKIKILNKTIGTAKDYKYGPNEACILYLEVKFNKQFSSFFGTNYSSELLVDYKNNIITHDFGVMYSPFSINF